MKTEHTTRRVAATTPRLHCSQRGVALVITLLLLLMMMALAVAMVLASGSDLLIGGHYRSHRGSFYSADSGLSIVRQQVGNQLAALAPATFPPGTPPLPANAAATVQGALLAQYGAYTNLNNGGAANSWPGNFRIDNFQLALAPGMPLVTSCAPLGGPMVNPACPGGGQPTGYRYIYNYEIDARGRSTGVEESAVEESGSIILNAALNPAAPMTVSFANWGFFVDNQPLCNNGSYLAYGTITGPVHSNGGWTFGPPSGGSYIFTDPVTQVDPDFGFEFGSNRPCMQDPTPPVIYRGQTINPTFQAGYSTGAAAVPLPQNDFSQKRAVLDGLGTNANNPTGAEMSAVLKRADGTAYPPAGANGVYMPYSVDPVTGVKNMTGGGIYIQGNASVVMETIGASGQRMTITQGGVTTTITIDPVAGTTTMQTGANPPTGIQGVPMDFTKTPPTDSAMLYVQGDVTSLSGPAQGVAAIQDGSAVTVTASGDVTITGDLLYKTPPITKAANDPCCPGTPAGTLIPNGDTGQVLGIFTATGDIQLDNQQDNQGPLTMEIDASLATLSQGGSGGVVNVGPRQDVLNIIGGRIQNNIKSIGADTRNVFYDRRFAAGLAPPWFPSTTVAPPGVATASFNSTTQRQRWYHTSAQ
ncbi:MAG: PilX N-terminal domain-containing pilus assembly protein [Candidatus Acidiferrales bacterium]